MTHVAQFLKESSENELFELELKRIGFNPVILIRSYTFYGSNYSKEFLKNDNDILVVHSENFQTWDNKNQGQRRTSIYFVHRNTKEPIGFFVDRKWNTLNPFLDNGMWYRKMANF